MGERNNCSIYRNYSVPGKLNWALAIVIIKMQVQCITEVLMTQVTICSRNSRWVKCQMIQFHIFILPHSILDVLGLNIHIRLVKPKQ